MSSHEPSEKLPSANATPRSAATGSALPLQDLNKNSVFDFLYHDARRIAAFLSQFHTYGALQSTKASETETRASSEKAAKKASGGVPSIFTGEISLDGSIGQESKDGTERTFDPLWKNATTLLDYLAENNLIQRQIDEARIGEFVLISGSLAVFDVALMRDLWTKPAMRRQLIASANHSPDQNRHERRKSAAAPISPELEIALDMLPMLPHSIQATVTAAAGTAWFTLQDTNLVTNASDLMLKHGIAVAGEWNVLGILDAAAEGSTYPSELFSAEQALAAASLGTGIVMHVGALAAAARQFLGRPFGAIGITPIMIFRQVM